MSDVRVPPFPVVALQSVAEVHAVRKALLALHGTGLCDPGECLTDDTACAKGREILQRVPLPEPNVFEDRDGFRWKVEESTRALLRREASGKWVYAISGAAVRALVAFQNWERANQNTPVRR